MRSEPTVSVVVPCFNVVDYVGQAVDSVLAQTVGDLEVIVVDGGSTDGTLDLLAGIRDSRVRIVRQNDRGLAAARNLGVRLAKSPHIGFLDGDDLWLPSKVEIHLNLLGEFPDTDLTFSLSAMIDEYGREIGLARWRTEDAVSFRELLTRNPVANGSSVIARREVLQHAGPFDSTLAALEDLDMWLRVSLLRSGNIRCISQVLTLYRRRRGQLSLDWRRIELGWHQLRDRLRSALPETLGDIEHLANSEQYRYYAWLAFENREFREAIRLLGAGLRESPRHIVSEFSTWLLALGCLSGMILPESVQREAARSAATLQRRVSRHIRRR